MKIEEYEQVYLRSLFYGDSGSGKTHLLGTAMLCPETRPLLVMNARGQPVTFRNFAPENRPLVLTVEHMEDFNEVYSWFAADQPMHRKLVESRTEWGSSNWFKVVARLPLPYDYIYKYLAGHDAIRFNSLGIDSMTQTQRISSDSILGVGRWKPSSVARKSTYNDFRAILSQMTKLADYHFQLHVHVFTTALERHNEVPTLGIVKYYPFLWGQSALEVPSYAECVGRLVSIDSLPTQRIMKIKKEEPEVFEGEYPFNVLLLKGGRDYIAKWQGIKHPPDVMINPTIPKMISIFKQNKGV